MDKLNKLKMLITKLEDISTLLMVIYRLLFYQKNVLLVY